MARLEGALAGVDLEVPFGAPEGDFRATVLLATTLAAKLELAVVDPQLGGELTPDKADAAVETWRAASKYAIDTAGRVEDARNAAPLEPVPPMVSPRGKAMLIGLGVLVVAYLVLSWLVTSLVTTQLKPID